ncbi:MAG: hypothetical protein WD844_02165 [Thermoleophilaceae bacterium]
MLIALADGGWILVVVAVLMILAVAYGFFTRSGSGIESHPRGRRRGGTTPGAKGRSEASGQDQGESAPMQHGTK